MVNELWLCIYLTFVFYLRYSRFFFSLTICKFLVKKLVLTHKLLITVSFMKVWNWLAWNLSGQNSSSSCCSNWYQTFLSNVCESEAFVPIYWDNMILFINLWMKKKIFYFLWPLSSYMLFLATAYVQYLDSKKSTLYNSHIF